MAKSRDSNTVTANSLPELVSQLNFVLQRLSDRLDKLEGIRDSFDSSSDGSFEGSLTAQAVEISDDNGTALHSLGDT